MRIHVKTLERVAVSDIFWLLIFLMIALPLHVTNNLLEYLSITGKISWFQVAIGVIFVYRGLTKVNKTTAYNVLFGISILITMAVGFMDSRHVMTNVIGDAGMYILSFMIFCLLAEGKVKSKSIDELMLFTFHAMTINLAINCIMYFTRSFAFWDLESYNNGRYGAGYYTVLIVSVVYGFYDFMSKKRIRPTEFFLHLVMSVFCSILAQSRTHVILCVAGCAVAFVFYQGKLSGKYLIRSMIVIVAAAIGICVFLNSDNALVDRLLSMDIRSNTETIASRVYTWIYYWRRICENPLGVGFGEIMYLINPSLTIAPTTATYYVDNAYACVLYKGGFLLGILYFIPVFAALIKLLEYWKKSKDKSYLMYAVIYAMLLLAATLLTSQIIHTYAVNVFIWVLIGILINKEHRQLQNN